MLGCLTASLLGLGVIIGCICGLVVPSKAAGEDVFIIANAEKIGEIKLGEYPQTFVGAIRNEQLLKDTTLTATGKKYTTYINTDKVELIEYLLTDGKTKVAKLSSTKWTFGSAGVNKTIRYSDNTAIQNGETYFFDVEPIKFDIFTTNGKVVVVAQMALGSMAFGTTNDWSQSSIRTFFHNTFASEANLTGYAERINHYCTKELDDRAGLPVTDSVWLPSACEMQVFYVTAQKMVRPANDFARATYTDDRGQFGSQLEDAGAVVFLRSAVGRDGDTVAGHDCRKLQLGDKCVTVSSTSFAYFPAFVLNDTTAQYKTEVTAATCTAGGYTESWWEINGQQFDYQKYDATEALGHAWGEWATVTESTCVNAGLQKHTCTVCGTAETVETNPDEAKHAYQETVVNPTCTTGGYTEHTCTNDGCTLSYRDNLLPALGHTWGEWQTTQDPTATTVGTAERECSVCHEKETKTIPALSPVTGTTDGGGNNNGTVWLIFGIIAGGVLVLGGGAVSWLFIAGIQRKKKTATAV